MPATEQTWRNTKRLHVVFGLSAVAMFLASLWMFAKDHQREFKKYKRTFRDLEQWTATSNKNDAETADYERELAELESAWKRELETPLADLDEFLATAGEDKERAQRAGYDLEAIREAQTEFAQARDSRDNHETILAARKKLLERITATIQLAQYDEDKKLQNLKFTRAERDAKQSEFNIKIGEDRDAETLEGLQAEVDAVKAEVEKQTVSTQEAKTHRLALQETLANMIRPEAAARERFEKFRAKDEQLKKAVDERTTTPLKALLQYPIIDAFGGPDKPDQIWLPLLTQNNNFRDVARFDRCVTCHQGIEKTAPGSAVAPGYESRRPLSVALNTPAKDPASMTASELLTQTQGISKSEIVSRAYGLSLVEETEGSPNAVVRLAETRVGSSADLAGARQGDTLVAVGGAQLDAKAGLDGALDALIALLDAGDDAEITLKGSAPESRSRTIVIESEVKRPAAMTQAELLDAAFGIVLAERGLFEKTDVTIAAVRARSLASFAELKAGDVIREIGGGAILDNETAKLRLLETADWGQPLQLLLDRGVPQPYGSHPRLDLFMGSLSPHKMGDFGCTICHEGQGSATEFKWASHSPNDLRQAEAWSREHGWFDNHHWIFPQLPKRFVESNCLKCHHDVTELEPSERFADPPAPKLMAGYHTIRQFGCFGCHEINGFDGPVKRRGPDLRAEPNYHAAAAQLLVDRGLNDEEKKLAFEVIAHPELTDVRKRLAAMVDADGLLATGAVSSTATSSGDIASTPRLSDASRKLATILGADNDTPGKLPKVGPSLRFVGKKVDLAFLIDWIGDPTRFRPSTKMPKFFGLHSHLQGDPGLEVSERFEPIEIRAIAEYLLSASEEQVAYSYRAREEGVESPSAERGKLLFETRGCLACHQHAGFSAAKDKQGPDLSRIGAKLQAEEGERGRQWLYTWLRNPKSYHHRTVMPDTKLERIEEPERKLEDGTVVPASSTDPAADIVEYLMTSRNAVTGEGEGDWKPAAVAKVDETDLDELALVYLRSTFTHSQAKKYLKEGIPAEKLASLKGDEVVLVGEGEMSIEKKLQYVGRRTISRLGCSACHDIPGYEDAKPIGTTLADWGRKETSKLAFEQVAQYIAKNGLHGDHGRLSMAHGGESVEHGKNGHGRDEKPAEVASNGFDDRYDEYAPPAEEEHEVHLDPREMGADGFFLESLLGHQRIGFLWQKLREPRAYDYKMTENKDYTERLRMPKFNFSDEQVEQVMTFVLGLVAEPPVSKYVYKADRRRQAILDGERVLEKFNCGGCHTLRLEEWEIEYDPAKVKAPSVKDFAFLAPYFTAKELQDSNQTDRRGKGHAKLRGRANLDADGLENGKTEDGTYLFTLWEAAAIHGETWWPAEVDFEVEDKNIKKRGFVGGDFARMLYPSAKAMKAANPELKNKKDTEVWGWLPPPLVNEGKKVQTAWLHDFLLEPHEIRPATIMRLRMPKFNLTADDASKLANYFAAVENAEFPYEFRPEAQADSAESASEETMSRRKKALDLLTSKTFCVNCHKVGDYTPAGGLAAMAPNLDRVHRRIRPDFLRRWIAHPSRLLPYTGMPVNFEMDKKVGQNFFPGTSEEQVLAIADLLMNFDTFTKQQFSIVPLVKEAPKEATPAETQAGAQ